MKGWNLPTLAWYIMFKLFICNWYCKYALFTLALYCTFRLFLLIVYVLLGISPVSNCSWLMFRNPLSVSSSKAGCRVWRWNWHRVPKRRPTTIWHRGNTQKTYTIFKSRRKFGIENVSAHLIPYRVSQEEWTKLRECVPYVELYQYNPKHLYPKLNGYGDNGQRKVWTSCISAYCTSTAVSRIDLDRAMQ